MVVSGLLVPPGLAAPAGRASPPWRKPRVLRGLPAQAGILVRRSFSEGGWGSFEDSSLTRFAHL